MTVFQTFRLLRIITLTSVCVLSLAGLFVLYDPTVSASHFFSANMQFFRQLLYLLIGVLVYRFLSHKDSQWYRDPGVVTGMFIGSLGLLVLVLLFGSTVNGAKSWFDFGLFSFQPADLVKIFFILYIAHFYERRHAYIRHPSVLGIPLGATIVVAGLLLLQPDFGTMIVFLGIWFLMTLAAGLWWKHTVILITSCLAILVVSWTFVFAQYQKDRILTFVNPERDPFGAGYNVVQSKVAIGAAGWLGSGVGEGTQGRLGFLPEHHTDFIFASFVEEWGLLGGLLVIIATLLLIICLLTAARFAGRVSDSLYLVGFASYITVHSIIHIGMNMGMLPVTGLPMPFMSFGGSHILTEAIGIAIALSMMSRIEPARTLGDVDYHGPNIYSLYG